MTSVISPVERFQSDIATADGAGRKRLVCTPDSTSSSSVSRIAIHTPKKRSDQRTGTAAGAVAGRDSAGALLIARPRSTDRADATRPR